MQLSGGAIFDTGLIDTVGDIGLEIGRSGENGLKIGDSGTVTWLKSHAPGIVMTSLQSSPVLCFQWGFDFLRAYLNASYLSALHSDKDFSEQIDPSDAGDGYFLCQISWMILFLAAAESFTMANILMLCFLLFVDSLRKT